VEAPGAGSSPASVAGGQTGGTGTGTSPAPSATGSPASLNTRTFRVTAGVVTASCLGARIQLVSAAPTNGWSMVVDASGPGEVEIEFARATSGEVKVEARLRRRDPVLLPGAEGPRRGRQQRPWRRREQQQRLRRRAAGAAVRAAAAAAAEATTDAQAEVFR
jgi:hypothetical protein